MSDYLPAGVTDEQCSSNPPDKEEDYEYDGGERYCWACGGRGWKVTWTEFNAQAGKRYEVRK